jgi:hypothetical protein
MTKERREELLRAGQTDQGEDFHWSADVDPLDFETRSITELNWGELRELMAVRSCATCRHAKLRIQQGYDPLVCMAEWPERPGRAAPTFDRRVTEDYSCVFWEPLAPETKGS